jgi:hypothetical protein
MADFRPVDEQMKLIGEMAVEMIPEDELVQGRV